MQQLVGMGVRVRHGSGSGVGCFGCRDRSGAGLQRHWVEVCNWSYDEDTTQEIPYRSDPQFPSTGAYAVAWSSARLNWNGADTPAEFTYAVGSGRTLWVRLRWG